MCIRDSRYAESEYTYFGGGGYTGTGFPVEGGSDEYEGANDQGYDFLSGGGGPGTKTKASPTPLPEELVDLPPSGMETDASTSPLEVFKEGVDTSTTAAAAKAAGGTLALLKDTGEALPASPANMAWNYVYNTIDNSIENNTVNNETNTFNESTEYNTEYNTENNTYNTYNTEENSSTTNNYYYGMGEGTGQVLDTAGLIAAIGAAGALAVGAIGALGTTLLGAIAGGAARGAMSQGSSGGYSAPPAQLLPGEPKSDRYVGFGGGNAPGKNCEQLLQEILQLGGSADELPESCRIPQT